MREQDVDSKIAAVIELDGCSMASVTGDFGDPAINDGYVAAPQIGPDIRQQVRAVGKQSQLVSLSPVMTENSSMAPEMLSARALTSFIAG